MRHPKGDEHKAIGKGVKDVREWLEMTSEDEGAVYLKYQNRYRWQKQIVLTVAEDEAMFKERKLRVRRDWQHAMKAKGEAGMGAMVHEMEESFKKSPKLYGSILIGIALTMILA